MQGQDTRWNWGLLAAAVVMMVALTGADLMVSPTPSRSPQPLLPQPSPAPIPVLISSPQGQALLRSSRPKTEVMDVQTGQVTALYAGFVAAPAAAANPAHPPLITTPAATF